MWNVCEQPWTLLVLSVALYLSLQGLFTVWERPWRRWYTGICVFLALTAVSLDFFIATDREKIRSTIKTAIRAVQEEDIPSLQAVIDGQYQDSYHQTYEQVIRHVQKGLGHSPVERNKIVNLFIDNVTSDRAAALLILLMHFQENSLVTQSYKPLIMVHSRFTLHKQPNRQWAIQRLELVEVDKQPVTWSQVSGQF